MATKPPTEANNAAPDGQAIRKFRWDTRHLDGASANFSDAARTREEVVLNFGATNNRKRTPQDMEIEFAHRIAVSPFPAKRLSGSLTKLAGECERRCGEVK
jgi:hypothetical protein